MRMTDAEEKAARAVIDEGLTKGERRALFRKIWILRGHSGGEVLLAERMAARGLFEGGRDGVGRPEYERTRLGTCVINHPLLRSGSPPPMWRLYLCDDGVWQCQPSKLAGWPKDVDVLVGKEPGPLATKAWKAMRQVAAPYIAAELRELASLVFSGSPDIEIPSSYVAERLRARADELDPPAKPKRRT